MGHLKEKLSKNTITVAAICTSICIVLAVVVAVMIKRSVIDADNNFTDFVSSGSEISSQISIPEIPSSESVAPESSALQPEVVVKPSTGSVLTAPEYKYVAKEDAPVNNKKIDIAPPAPITTVNTGILQIEVTGDYVNIRSGPGTLYGAVSKANSGAVFNYLEQAFDSNNTIWYHIEGNNVNGWIISQYTKAIEKKVSSADWRTENGNRYCYVNGVPLKGWASVDGYMYRFNATTGAKESYVGIDVSSHQGTINWTSVKSSGVDYAFIRVGYRGYGTDPGNGTLHIDPCFAYNIKNATAVGIKCGVYFYSTAINETESREEASFVLNAIKGYKLEMPVVLDEEHVGNRVAGLTPAQRTDNAIAFLEAIKNAGYNPCLYTYFNYYNNYLEKSRVSGYTLWIAYYTTDSTRLNGINYKYWQYSSSGSVPGISGRVDMNVIFETSVLPGNGNPWPDENPSSSSSDGSSSEESSSSESSETGSSTDTPPESTTHTSE